jgi:hypothetical protein
MVNILRKGLSVVEKGRIQAIATLHSLSPFSCDEQSNGPIPDRSVSILHCKIDDRGKASAPYPSHGIQNGKPYFLVGTGEDSGKLTGTLPDTKLSHRINSRSYHKRGRIKKGLSDELIATSLTAVTQLFYGKGTELGHFCLRDHSAEGIGIDLFFCMGAGRGPFTPPAGKLYTTAVHLPYAQYLIGPNHPLKLLARGRGVRKIGMKLFDKPSVGRFYLFLAGPTSKAKDLIESTIIHI